MINEEELFFIAIHIKFLFKFFNIFGLNLLRRRDIINYIKNHTFKWNQRNQESLLILYIQSNNQRIWKRNKLKYFIFNIIILQMRWFIFCRLSVIWINSLIHFQAYISLLYWKIWFYYLNWYLSFKILNIVCSLIHYIVFSSPFNICILCILIVIFFFLLFLTILFLANFILYSFFIIWIILILFSALNYTDII